MRCLKAFGKAVLFLLFLSILIALMFREKPPEVVINIAGVLFIVSLFYFFFKKEKEKSNEIDYSQHLLFKKVKAVLPVSKPKIKFLDGIDKMRILEAIGGGLFFVVLFWYFFDLITGLIVGVVGFFIVLNDKKSKSKATHSTSSISNLSFDRVQAGLKEANLSADFDLPQISSNLKKYLEADGFFTLWKGSPITISFRAESEQKGRNHTFSRWAISSRGYEKLFCRDEDGLEYLVDVLEIDSKIVYKSQRYDLVDEIIEKIIGVSKFSRLDEIRQDYLEYVEELKERLKPKPQQLYSFTPIPLTFSIFGDYFNYSQPANNMRFSMLCSGLYGYRSLEDGEQYITALVGKNIETGEDVQIRVNAIRTMITLEDGRKYKKDAFIELAKQLI